MPTMSTLTPFQIEDLARGALRDGAILSWEQDPGKSFADGHIEHFFQTESLGGELKVMGGDGAG